MFDPLDAPENDQPAPLLYPTERIHLLIWSLVFLMPFNWVGHTWCLKIKWTLENLWIMLMIQLLMGVLIAFLVGIYAFFKQQHLPYFVRFGQWFLSAFVTFQVLYTIGLLFKCISLM